MTRRTPQQTLKLFAFLTGLAISLATWYSILAIQGKTIASLPIFFGFCGFILIPHSFLTLTAWKYRSLFNHATRVFFLLWTVVAFWYLTFVPVYYFSNMTLNTLQTAISMFAYFWQVPVFGAFIFAYVAYRWFLPFQKYLDGTLKPADPQKFYKQVLQYPSRVMGWAFFCSAFAYMLSSGYLTIFGYMPVIELVKNTANGMAVASFMCIIFYLFLDLFLSDIRRKLKTEYPVLIPEIRTLTAKIAGINIFLVVGTTILVSLIGLKSFQDIVWHNLERTMTELIPSVSENFFRAETPLEELSVQESFVYGKEGKVYVFPLTEFFSREFSPETNLLINRNTQGVIQDVHKTMKVVAFFKDEQKQKIVISLVSLPEFYRLFFDSINLFVGSLLSILAMTVAVSLFISIIVTQSLRTLSTSIHHLRERKDALSVALYTGDEVEELSHRLSQYVQTEKEMEERRNKFILATQHNLRTPLTVVKGYVQEIDSQVKKENVPHLKNYLEETNAALDTMGKLVNGLVDVTDPELGKGGMIKTDKS